MSEHFIGIDVGTGSARAGLFDATGRLLAVAKRPIRMWREAGDIVEQSSEDIWEAITACVREALASAAVPALSVRGVGFDATCSLVVLDGEARPLPVGPSGDPARNIVVWMDHRAMAQADRINAIGHPVVEYVGGTISPEMETPKLLWLKEHQPDTFVKAAHFFDLADYLTFRATGATERSVCTVTCKWTYLAHEGRWDPGYFEAIGLGDLTDDGFARIGSRVVDIATPLGRGLTPQAADELGLEAGTPVGASLIDAHAGGVGTLGALSASGTASDPTSELALIMGTSLCSMALTREPVFVDGVWGPYFGALLPGTWLLEGGQSAYGAALDHIIALHPAYSAALAGAAADGVTIFDRLEANAVRLAGSIEAAANIAERLHVVPELLGNRAPEADPHATGVIAGLTLASDEDDLTRLFVATLCGLCYGTLQIIEANREKGVIVETIVVSGGASRSQLLRRILADATGLKVTLPETDEPVLLGAAMLGAVASGHYPALKDAAAGMCRQGATIEPMAEASAFHARKYEAFRILQQGERRIRALFAPPA